MFNKNSKKLLTIFILIIHTLLKQFNTLDYCCCMFKRDPFRGFLNSNNKIMSFDHSYFDKEGMGYKMINQCYRQNDGFPSLESIELLKKDINQIGSEITRTKEDFTRELTRMTAEMAEARAYIDTSRDNGYAVQNTVSQNTFDIKELTRQLNGGW